MTAPWPWPGDTVLDQSRRVARSYRQALLDAAPDACAALDEKLTTWGQGWIVPRAATVDPNAWVTVDVAADHTGLTAAAIYKWISRDQRVDGHKGNDGRLRVRIADLLAANAELRQRRAERRS